jgi:hypothetical protein
VQVLPYESEQLKRNDILKGKGLKNAKTLRKKPDATKYSKPKSIWRIKNVTPNAPPPPVAPVN